METKAEGERERERQRQSESERAQARKKETQRDRVHRSPDNITKHSVHRGTAMPLAKAQ